ncbi:hypothetical protein GCM10011514_54940 [Emticicia aquatilis]|uniref:Ig-like domain-containing protein n=1 Tax=Emticicia aquatilis TaxID=1537369 RepID=A0A916ZA76_9BACT|nr:3-coathanger stack domain-containing protein [Emticicia aquatilis]GGD83938.1 hypothetical protein GCM10011514_54940 [Emticicia aquatilis]
MKYTTLLLLFLSIVTFAQVNLNPSITTNSENNSLCNQKEIILSVSIKNSDYTYSWYRDDIAITFSNTPFYTANKGGKYYVKVTGKDFEQKSDEIFINDCEIHLQKNSDIEDHKEQSFESKQKELLTNFNTVSKNYTIKLAQGLPQLVSTNPVICGSNTSTTLSVTNTDPSYTYTWLYSTSSSGNFSTIPNQTSSTYTTSTVGYYKVFISDGNGNITIGPLYVSNTPYGIISDSSNNPFGTINTTVGQPVQLKFTLFGTGPWTINYYDGSSSKSVVTTTTPFFLTVSPTQNRSYYISYVSNNNCGTGYSGNSGLVRVVVDATTAINLTTPTTTTVCPGGTIEIPYTTVGTWTNERKIYLELTNSSGTSTYASYGYYASNSMFFTIPSYISSGSYKIKANVDLPSISLPTISTYTINVSGSICSPTAYITVGASNFGCSNVSLYANPSSSDYTFQWYLNGSLISGATNYYYNATQTGNYTVRVSKSSTGFSSTSAMQSVVVTPFQSKITSNNPALCGTNTTATLNASPTGVGFTYQWFKLSSVGNLEPIDGAVQQSYTTNVSGQYYVNINNGSCSNTSNSYYVGTGPVAIISDMNDEKYTDVNTTVGQPAQLKVSLYGGNSWTFTYNDGSNARIISTNTSPFILTLSPEQNRRYSISNVTSNCSNNSGYTTGYNNIIIDPSTALNLTTPGSTTACSGGSISIPYTTIGTWTSERNIALELVDVNGSFSTYSYISGFATNPMVFPIPESLPIGTYKIRAYNTLPFIANSTLSSYSINVNSTGCSTSAIFTVNYTNVSCTSVYLTAYPYSSSNAYSYQWYLNGNIIPNQTGRNFTATQTGNYSVRVTRASSNYDQTTSQQTITITGFTASITSPNSVICGTNTTAILNASSGGVGATYQWFYSASMNSLIPIDGTTGQSYTATAVGYYRVLVKQSSSNCESLSSTFYVGNTPYGVLGDQNDNSTATINISSGQTANLKMTLHGQAPWVVRYYDGSQSRVVNVTSSPYILQVTPNQNKMYYISSVSNSCGDGYGSGNVIVNIDNSTSIILNTPNSTNICAGGTIDVPYTTVGTWTNERSINIELIDVNGNYVSGSSIYTAFTNPIRYSLPSSLTLNGTYRVRVRPNLPYMSNYTVSSYTLTVTNTGCLPSAVIYLGTSNNTNSNSNNICGNAPLFASPSANGNLYRWYRDGNLVYTSTGSSSYYTSISGNYSVIISNSSTGYNSTSLNYPITINMESAGFSGNPVLCDGESAITLSGYPTSGNYEWFYSPTGTGFSKVVGQSSSNLTTSNPGIYYFTVNSGSCQSISSTYRTCPILLNYSSATVCQQSGLSITFSSYLYLSTVKYTLQLINANNQVIVNDNLASVMGSTSMSTYALYFNLPSTVGAGTYKLRVVSDIPNYTSTSVGILTVNSSISSVAPTLAANPSTITSTPQNVTLTATGCSGTVFWSNNVQGSTQIVSVQNSTTFTAYCSVNNCNSSLSSVLVTLDCDPLEPNNTYSTPTVITNNSYQSADLCFDSGLDKDYFAWIYNGKIYYILVRPFSNSSIGKYKLFVSMNNGILTMETKAIAGGSNLDTYIILYDSNGTSELSYDDDSGDGNFSLLNYTLPTNPCPSSLELYSSLFDVLSGQNTTPKAVLITAANKLNDSSNSNYRAEKAIMLNPGFETKYSSSGTFKAEIKGCSDS